MAIGVGALYANAAPDPVIKATLITENGYAIRVDGSSFPAKGLVKLTFYFGANAVERSVSASGSGDFTHETGVPTGFVGAVRIVARCKRTTINAVVNESPTTGNSTPNTTNKATTTLAQSPTTVMSGGGDGLDNPVKKDIAMQLVSANENSSLAWKAQYAYIEYNVEGNSDENRGYTAGIIGFCTKCGDLAKLVEYYNSIAPNNVLSKYSSTLNALAEAKSASTDGLGDAFVRDWKTAASDAKFTQAQDHERDRVYFNPAVDQARADGLGTLGQFIYYDAIVMHGPGSDSLSFGGIRAAAMRNAATVAQGGDEATYLMAFLDARRAAMKSEAGHSDTTRLDTEQMKFVESKNFDLQTPLSFSVYGETFTIP